MSKYKMIILSRQEIEYLLELVLENKDDGSYWGREDYFIKRQKKVIDKLQTALEIKLEKE